MVFMLVDSSFEVVGYPNVERAGLTAHDVDVKRSHTDILTTLAL